MSATCQRTEMDWPRDLAPAQLCLWAVSAPAQGLKSRAGNKERKQVPAGSTSEPQRARYGCVGPVSGAGDRNEKARGETEMPC